MQLFWRYYARGKPGKESEEARAAHPAGLTLFAFQLRPLCIITQSLMHVTASESLADFGKKQK